MGALVGRFLISCPGLHRRPHLARPRPAHLGVSAPGVLPSSCPRCHYNDVGPGPCRPSGLRPAPAGPAPEPATSPQTEPDQTSVDRAPGPVSSADRAAGPPRPSRSQAAISAPPPLNLVFPHSFQYGPQPFELPILHAIGPAGTGRKTPLRSVHCKAAKAPLNPLNHRTNPDPIRSCIRGERLPSLQRGPSVAVQPSRVPTATLVDSSPRNRRCPIVAPTRITAVSAWHAAVQRDSRCALLRAVLSRVPKFSVRHTAEMKTGD